MAANEEYKHVKQMVKARCFNCNLELVVDPQDKDESVQLLGWLLLQTSDGKNYGFHSGECLLEAVGGNKVVIPTQPKLIESA